MSSAEGRTVGSYILRSLIGSGGTSEVHAAEHRFLGDRVAIKLLRAELALDDEAADAFVAEAAKTRAIQHPNVVRVLDFGRDEATRRCYLVLEQIEGESLSARIRGTRLSEAEVRRLGAAIADGMQAAHAIGIVHRDLKPGNVMLAGDDPKIVDFGIAKYLGNDAAATTSRRIGTPAYMAPEQLTGGLIAPCVDIWALGVILFEAVTGRLPFENFADGRCPQLFEAAPRASTLAPISASLDDLIARCLEREPGRRPISMAAIAGELRGTDSGERITLDAGAPLLAAPLVPAHPVRSRRVWPAALGGAGALAAIVIGVMVLGSSDSDGSSDARPVTPRAAAIVPDAVPHREVDAAVEIEIAEVEVAEVAVTEVDIRSTPVGAAIYIDGRRRGVTPARISVTLPAALVLKRRGYVDARIRAETSPIHVKLVKLPRARPDPQPPDRRETLD